MVLTETETTVRVFISNTNREECPCVYDAYRDSVVLVESAVIETCTLPSGDTVQEYWLTGRKLTKRGTIHETAGVVRLSCYNVQSVERTGK